MGKQKEFALVNCETEAFLLVIHICLSLNLLLGCVSSLKSLVILILLPIFYIFWVGVRLLIFELK